MRFTPDDMSDLSGRTAIVTGANSGIGWHTADELARHGASVVLACRDRERGEEAAARIEGATRVEQLDLASLQSVQDFAERWDGPLDLLINNAGVMMSPTYRTTADGFELQFGTNHLGHFALTGRLLPHLLATAAPRVVTVSSNAHHRGKADLIDMNPEASYRGEPAYNNSKLANLMFGLELHRRAQAAGSPLVSTMAHPGGSNTNLFSAPDGLGANPIVRRLAPIVLPLVLQSAARGADATLYAATLGTPGSYTGPTKMRGFSGPVGPATPSQIARDPQLAVQLWELSEQATGVTFNF
ncbi:MAG TPA: oxidoreductase [Marmoricola sp.]|nr:oxidoreductase [Marmoricola sp.]